MNVFLAVTVALFIVAIVSAVINHTTFYKNNVLSYKDPYMDFFNHIAYVKEPSKVYFSDVNACFPPLIYIMFYFFNRVLPTQLIFHSVESITYEAMTLYIVFVAAVVMAFGFCVKKYLKDYNDFTSFGVALMCLISSAFTLTAIDRGNTVILVLVILLAAMYFKSSKNKALNELALILIAIAAGIKIYPALFGILYIIEGKKKEAVRLIIYGLLFFFVPFAFFGGISGFKQFLTNQIDIQNFCSKGCMSIKKMAEEALLLLKVNADVANLIGMAIVAIFLVISIIALISKQDSWKNIFLITSVICFAPLWSGPYTTIYFIIPMLMLFAKSKKGFSKLDIFYAVGFAVAFSLYTLPYRIVKDSVVNIVRLVPLYLMTISIIIESYINMFKHIKSKKADKIKSI